MKQGWEIKKLGEIARIINGYAFDSKLFSTDENDMPLIRIRDIKKGYTETFYKGKYSDNYIVKNGDYIIGMDGEFNITEWGGGDALLNQRVCKIEFIDDSVIGRYVLRFLSIELKRIEDATSFVTVKHLSSKSLLSISVPVPERAEQERIVGELDCLSGIIAAKRAQLRELDTLAQSIFYTMFGDPITNDKGWQTKKLGDVCDTTSGGTPSKKHAEYYENGTIPWLRSGEIDKTFISSTELCITEQGVKNSSAKWFPINTVVIAMYGATVGQVGVLKAAMTTNQAICGIFPNDIFAPVYLYYFLRSMKTEFIKLSSGGAQPNISQSIIRDTIVSCPPILMQQQFAEKIEQIETQKLLIKQSIINLEQLFNSRMYYYFE